MTDSPDTAAVPSLAGRAVGITAGRRIDEQVRFFERHGATVHVGPAVRSVSAADEPGFADAVRSLLRTPPDVVLLHTGTGVRAWFDGAAQLGLADELAAVLRRAVVYARGPKSVRAAGEHGLDVAWQSPRGRYADLVAKVAADHPGARVAVQLDGELDDADGGDDLDPDGTATHEGHLVGALHDAAGEVVAVPIYRWDLPVEHGPAHELVRLVAAGRVDAVTFTSSPAVAGLVALAGEIGAADDLRSGFAGGVRAASIGEVCSATLRRSGIEPSIEPERPRLGSLLLAVAAALAPDRR